MTAVPLLSFQHEIESPLPLYAKSGDLRLAGWCVTPSQSTAPKVRLVIPGTGQPLGTVATVHRADVIAALGLESSAVDCGFVIKSKLRPGAHFATLEASCGGLHWEIVRQFAIIATPGDLQASIEWPVGPTVQESVRVQGWCVHPDFTIAEVWLHYGNRRLRCEYGLSRTDVPGLFPQAPNATHAGFIAEKNLPAGYGQLRIRAVTSEGESVFAEPAVVIDIARDEENPTPLDLHGKFPDLGPARRKTPARYVPSPERNAKRVLFVLYGDFTSNSALHVSNLANELIALGHECVVTVPHNVETIRYHPEAQFHALSFDECLKNPAVFRDVWWLPS